MGVRFHIWGHKSRRLSRRSSSKSRERNCEYADIFHGNISTFDRRFTILLKNTRDFTGNVQRIMATLIGQQVFELASAALKMAAAALTVHDTRTTSGPLPKWPLPQYTLSDVSWHYQPHDCWMVIYDKVYDLSGFFLEHPGGDEVLSDYAGRDATLAFGGVGHSAEAIKMMDKYLIGILVEHERLYLGSDRS